MLNTTIPTVRSITGIWNGKENYRVNNDRTAKIFVKQVPSFLGSFWVLSVVFVTQLCVELETLPKPVIAR